MITLFALPLLLALPGDGSDATPAPPPEQESSVLVRYDLSAAIPALDNGSGWSQTLAPDLALRWSEGEWVSYRSGLHEAVPPEVVQDVIGRVLGDELLERGRLASLEGDSTLVVVAPAAVQAKVAKVLATFERALAARDVFRLDLLSQESDGDQAALLDKGLLEPEEADGRIANLAGRGAQLRSLTFRLTPGRTTALDEGRDEGLVIDYDVEIAQAAGIFDPIVGTYRDGFTFLAHGVRRGAATACTLLLRGSTPLSEVQERALTMDVGIGSDKLGTYQFYPGPSSLQNIDLLGRSVAFTTLVPDDRVVAFASRYSSGGRAYTQTAFLRRESGSSTPFYKATFGSTTLLLVNSEIFSPPSFSFSAQQSEEGYGDHPLLQADYSPGQASFLFDWLKYRFSIWRRMGPWAVIVTDPAWDNQALPALESLLASLHDDDRVVQWSTQLDAADGTPVAGWSLPVLAGTEVGAMLGKTTQALVDYDVEVAQLAGIPDPLVAPLFDGLVFRAKLLPGARPGADVEAWGRRLALPIERAQRHEDLSRFSLPVDRYRMDSSYADERVDLQPGSSVRLGGKSKGAGGTGLGVTVGVR